MISDLKIQIISDLNIAGISWVHVWCNISHIMLWRIIMLIISQLKSFGAALLWRYCLNKCNVAMTTAQNAISIDEIFSIDEIVKKKNDAHSNSMQRLLDAPSLDLRTCMTYEIFWSVNLKSHTVTKSECVFEMKWFWFKVLFWIFAET